MDQNNKNNKPGGGKNGSNWRGFIHLICWAVLLTVLVSYAADYMTSTGHNASAMELEYNQFQTMVEGNQVARVDFDTDEATC